MLSVSSISASDVAGLADYYESLAAADDYYESGKEPPGYWLGYGALALRLEGEIREGELLRGLQGYHPATGAPLAENAGDQHKPGWDCTFSAPKSYSAAWVVADPELRAKIEEAWHASVRVGTDYLEREAIRTRHGRAGEDQRPVLESGGIVAAAYDHSASRAQQPQKHTHVLVLNTTPDGRGIDLDTRHKMAAGALQRVELAHRLREIGFQVERDGQSFKIAGVPDRLVEHWSARRAEIEAALAERGLSSAKAAEVAALDTRAAKEQAPREELFARWEAEAREYGFTAESVRELAQRGKDAPVLEMKPDAEITADLTSKHASFSRVQALKAVAVEAQGVMTAREAEAHLSRVLTNPEVVNLRAPERFPRAEHIRPGERYTTREMLQIEREMLERAERMGQHHSHQVSEAALARAAEKFPTLSGEQTRAVEHITRDTGSFAVVQGRAGTGKSFMLNAAREAWQADGYRVIGTALSNQATRNLESKSGITSLNTAKLAVELGEGRLTMDNKTILAVDEAGMIGTRQMDVLIARAEAAGSKVVLTGDTRQLPAIEAGAPMRAIAERVGQVELTEVRRQRDPVEREIALDFREGRAADALTKLAERGQLHVAQDMRVAQTEAVKGYFADREAGETSMVVAATRAEVCDLNCEIRAQFQERGEVAREGVQARVSTGYREFSQGDQVIFGQKFHFAEKGDQGRSVWNGATGKIIEARQAGSGAELYVRLDHSDKEVRVDTRAMDKIDHGYAGTVHKAQGADVDNNRVVAGDMASKEWAYVAGSRHREKVHFHTSRDHVPEGVAESVLARDMSRSQAKDMATDYSRASNEAHVVTDSKTEPARRAQERTGEKTAALDKDKTTSRESRQERTQESSGAKDKTSSRESGQERTQESSDSRDHGKQSDSSRSR